METIFSRLRSMETQGQPLHALIVEACDCGDGLVEAVRSLLPILEAVRYTAGLGKNQMERVAKAKTALACAYVNDGHTPDNGKAAA
jgi:hypothetical protein